MGDDLRKYMPRMSTIMRETDPRKMEERHRSALEDPALQAAIAERAQETPDSMRVSAPGPWGEPGLGGSDEGALPGALNSAPGGAWEEARPVTKPAVAEPEQREQRQRGKKMMVGIAAVLAVAAPTSLGILMASRHARRGAAESAGARAAVTASASAAAPSATPTTAAPGSTGSMVVMSSATAAASAPTRAVASAATGRSSSTGKPHDSAAPVAQISADSSAPAPASTTSAAAPPAVTVVPKATAPSAKAAPIKNPVEDTRVFGN